MSETVVRELFQRAVAENDAAAMRAGLERLFGLSGKRAVTRSGGSAPARGLRDGDAAVGHALDRNAEDLVGQVARCCPEGVDAVADVAGGPMVSRLLPLIRDDGRWVIAGAVAGPVIEFDLRRLYLHNIRLIGSSMHTPAPKKSSAAAGTSGRSSSRSTDGPVAGDRWCVIRPQDAHQHDVLVGAPDPRVLALASFDGEPRLLVGTDRAGVGGDRLQMDPAEVAARESELDELDDRRRADARDPEPRASG